jgi:hypothetical protein
MKQQTFEDYLQDVFMKDYHGIGDDAPDAYEAFISQLDGAEIMELAEDWGKKEYEKGCFNTANEAKSLASNPN